MSHPTSTTAPSSDTPNENKSHTESGRQYLERHEIPALLQQAITLCIHNKSEKKPIEIISTFFDSLLTHRHALFLPFKQLNATRYTRLSFISCLQQCYSSIPHDTIITPDIFHQYITLLCYDFPFSLIRNASRITQQTHTNADHVGDTWIKLQRKVCILFYYSEFMNQAALAFRTIDRHSSGRVPSLSFAHQLHAVIQHKHHVIPCPSEQIISHVLRGDGEIMFNSFCVELFQHDDIMPKSTTTTMT